MTTLIHERVEQARLGTNPTVIERLPSGWVVLGDVQFLRGYSLLLADPVAPDINALNEKARSRFLLDMAMLGDALLEVTGAYRINYEILGNTDPSLHAHVFPRYLSEPEDMRKRPVWLYDREYRRSVSFCAERDALLMAEIRASLRKRNSNRPWTRGK